MHLDAQAINSVEAFSKADTCTRYPDVYYWWKTAKEFIEENHRYGNELSIKKKILAIFPGWLLPLLKLKNVIPKEFSTSRLYFCIVNTGKVGKL